ncbi:hypothetical protein PQY66_02250 [Luminiphilus sp.]|nr:hypothetical protein [Luminiphilus sp.]
MIIGWVHVEGTYVSSAICQYQNEVINSGQMTTSCQQSIVSEDYLVKLSEGLPLDIAVLMECALPTGTGVVISVTT